MRKVVVLLLLLVAIAIAPSTANAVLVMIDDLGDPAAAFQLFGATSVNLFGTYGAFQISNILSTRPAIVSAVDGDTVDSLSLTDAVIRNTLSPSTDFRSISIVFEHTFAEPLLPGGEQFWGASLSGSFVRPFSPFVASGDGITMASFGNFEDCGEGCVKLVESQIGKNLEYTVVSINSFAPQNPAQQIASFSCNDLVFEGSCPETVFSSIRTELQITLRGGDSIRLPGSSTSGVSSDPNAIIAFLRDLEVEPDPVPEPATLVLLLSGLVGLVTAGRRRLGK